jgi:hypothetical protein
MQGPCSSYVERTINDDQLNEMIGAYHMIGQKRRKKLARTASLSTSRIQLATFLEKQLEHLE